MYVRMSSTSNGLCSRSYITTSMFSSTEWVMASIGALPMPLKLAKLPNTIVPASSRRASWLTRAVAAPV